MPDFQFGFEIYDPRDYIQLMSLEYVINHHYSIANTFILKKYENSVLSQLILAIIFSFVLYYLIGLVMFFISLGLLVGITLIEAFSFKYDQIEFSNYAIQMFKQKSGKIIKYVPINSIESFNIIFKQYYRHGFLNFGLELILQFKDLKTEKIDLSNFVSNEFSEVNAVSQSLRDYFVHTAQLIDLSFLN